LKIALKRKKKEENMYLFEFAQVFLLITVLIVLSYVD